MPASSRATPGACHRPGAVALPLREGRWESGGVRTGRLTLTGLALLAVAFPAAGGAARTASAAERAAIIAAVRTANTAVGRSPARCDRASIVRVSTVDGRFARWSQNGR